MDWLRKISIGCSEGVSFARLWGKLVCKKERVTVIYSQGFMPAEIAEDIRRRAPIEVPMVRGRHCKV